MLLLGLVCQGGEVAAQASVRSTDSASVDASLGLPGRGDVGAEQRMRKLKALVGPFLEREGLLPETAPDRLAAPATAFKALPESRESAVDQVDRVRVAGVLIRFSDPVAQRLARDNQGPPPKALTVIDGALRQAKLVYMRAMTGRTHVFQFDEPLDLGAAQAIAQHLRGFEGVELVELDSTVVRQAVSYDPWFLSYPYNMVGPSEGYAGGIEATEAWKYTTGSPGTVVAIVDTGVLPHPEFSYRLLPGYDFVSSAENSNDGDGRDSDPSDPGDFAAAGECEPSAEAYESSWHGTHIAGIIGANGADGIGIAGVAWQTRLLPARALGKCGAGTMSDIIDAIQWAAGLPVPGVPSNPNPAQIINLSLSGYSPNGCNQIYQEAIDAAIGQGALVVAAAGNESDDIENYTPANCRGVLAVAAVDPYGKLASYSNLGFSDGGIAAPGGDMSRFGYAGGIFSTSWTGTTGPGAPTWKALQGTSMAVPHVSGIAALAHAVNPNLSGSELAVLLQYSANPYPSGTYCATYDACGAGIASALGGVAAAELMSDYRLVYEFFNTELQHYFRTGSKSEAGMINAGSAGPGWNDTFDYFYAWSGPFGGAHPVCRFYGTPGIGPNSHFYTASGEECESVKRDPGWTYEGIAFYAKLSADGQCRPGERPVYRAYNMRWMQNDSNHRYTTDYATYSAMLAQGWAPEGVAFCVAS